MNRTAKNSMLALVLALFFFGGMVLSILPQQQGISWEYHFSGAVFGLLTGLLFSGLDTTAPKRLYSWDIEEQTNDDEQENELNLPKPNEVPVIWQRLENEPERKVLPFKRRDN